jgi:hypothetical protein
MTRGVVVGQADAQAQPFVLGGPQGGIMIATNVHAGLGGHAGRRDQRATKPYGDRYAAHRRSTQCMSQPIVPAPQPYRAI